MNQISTDKISRGVFGARFTKQFLKGKREGRWKSHEDFGQKLNPSVLRGSVANWSKGKNIPTPERLKEICEVFGVPEDYFDTSNATRDELYQYESEYMTEIMVKDAIPFCKLIGLDLDFLRGVRSVMGDKFDISFPIWTPIMQNPQRASVENYIRSRSSLAVSAQTDQKHSVFQVNAPEVIGDESSRRLVTMGHADLEFLRDLQEEVSDYIEFQFLRRLKGQIKEVEEANRRSLVPLSDGGYAIRQLKAEELNQIDKYGRYRDEKSDPEVRDATQEDMDNFTNGGQTITDKNGLKVEVRREATQEDWDKFFGKSGGK